MRKRLVMSRAPTRIGFCFSNTSPSFGTSLPCLNLKCGQKTYLKCFSVTSMSLSSRPNSFILSSTPFPTFHNFKRLKQIPRSIKLMRPIKTTIHFRPSSIPQEYYRTASSCFNLFSSLSISTILLSVSSFEPSRPFFLTTPRLHTTVWYNSPLKNRWLMTWSRNCTLWMTLCNSSKSSSKPVNIKKAKKNTSGSIISLGYRARQSRSSTYWWEWYLPTYETRHNWRCCGQLSLGSRPSSWNRFPFCSKPSNPVLRHNSNLNSNWNRSQATAYSHFLTLQPSMIPLSACYSNPAC